MNDPLAKLRANITSVFMGAPEAVDRILCCLLARGHVLIEDVPGVGKTVLASALARSIDCVFARIQLTPDLLPGDILGVTILRRDTSVFEFRRGPIFANVVLADEINRATPRTQTALLEAMNEASVTIDGVTHQLEPPFMLVATQNPYDFEGTYPLPENQLDRFMMRVSLGYPSAEDEARVLELRPAGIALHALAPVMHASDVIAMQERCDRIRLDPSLTRYIVALAAASRGTPELQVGVSPRGSLALAQAARAAALLAGRDYVTPEDILASFVPVCAHRVIPRAYAAGSSLNAAAPILERVLESVRSPA